MKRPDIIEREDKVCTAILAGKNYHEVMAEMALSQWLMFVTLRALVASGRLKRIKKGHYVAGDGTPIAAAQEVPAPVPVVQLDEFGQIKEDISTALNLFDQIETTMLKIVSGLDEVKSRYLTKEEWAEYMDLLKLKENALAAAAPFQKVRSV
jgi:hypothetical protein